MWKTIESAPEHKVVLTQHEDDLYPVPAFYVSQKGIKFWFRETEGPEDTTDNRKGKYEQLYRPPTHWQELPPSPRMDRAWSEEE